MISTPKCFLSKYFWGSYRNKNQNKKPKNLPELSNIEFSMKLDSKALGEAVKHCNDKLVQSKRRKSQINQKRIIPYLEIKTLY